MTNGEKYAGETHNHYEFPYDCCCSCRITVESTPLLIEVSRNE